MLISKTVYFYWDFFFRIWFQFGRNNLSRYSHALVDGDMCVYMKVWVSTGPIRVGSWSLTTDKNVRMSQRNYTKKKIIPKHVIIRPFFCHSMLFEIFCLYIYGMGICQLTTALYESSVNALSGCIIFKIHLLPVYYPPSGRSSATTATKPGHHLFSLWRSLIWSQSIIWGNDFGTLRRDVREI